MSDGDLATLAGTETLTNKTLTTPAIDVINEATSAAGVTVDGCLIKDGVAASATQLSTASGSAPSYSARAWVNFNGTGAVAIRASGNVTSITDNNTGDYTINFATALPDADYELSGSARSSNATNGCAPTEAHTSSVRTTSAVRVRVVPGNGAAIDSEIVTISIHR